MRTFPIATLLSLVLSTAAAAVTDEELVLSLRSSGAVLVPVAINGRGPFTFLLDTGSSHTSVSDELVDRLALPVAAKTRVSTAVGVQMRLVVRLEHMSIGSTSVEGLMPSVVSLAHLRRMESGVDGVIGQDFLSAFDYTIDYRRKRLRWTAERDDVHVRLPLIRTGDRSLVQLSGNGSQGPVLMVPDSGSQGFVIFERNGRTAVSVDDINQTVGVSALALRQAGRGAVLRELRVGAVTLRNQPAVVLEGQGSKAIEGDGLMPLHQFSSVSFNNSEAYMVVRR